MVQYPADSLIEFHKSQSHGLQSHDSKNKSIFPAIWFYRDILSKPKMLGSSTQLTQGFKISFWRDNRKSFDSVFIFICVHI